MTHDEAVDAIAVRIDHELNLARRRFPGFDFQARRVPEGWLRITAIDMSYAASTRHGPQYASALMCYADVHNLAGSQVFQAMARSLVMALEEEGLAARADPVAVAVELVGFERAEVRSARLVRQRAAYCPQSPNCSTYALEVDLVDSDWEPTYEFTSTELTEWQRECEFQRRLKAIR